MLNSEKSRTVLLNPLSRFSWLMAPSNIQAKVAETAWRVWPLVFNDGPQTLVQLRKKLVCPADPALLGFALGWLAWENKIEIRYEKNTYRVETASCVTART